MLPHEKEITESLFFVVGLIIMSQNDPEGIREGGIELRQLILSHFSRILHYRGTTKDVVEGRTEALKQLATLETVLPGLQDELVSHTLNQLG
jgi:hypothetical protein